MEFALLERPPYKAMESLNPFGLILEFALLESRPYKAMGSLYPFGLFLEFALLEKPPYKAMGSLYPFWFHFGVCSPREATLLGYGVPLPHLV